MTQYYNIGPKVAEFNPANYVYINEDGEKCLDLNARLAWFRSVHPGWRISLDDAVRIVGAEIWVNNVYADAKDKDKQQTVREKETIFICIGYLSMIDDKGVRVLTVPMHTDFTDPDFTGRLFELGAEFLLDINGFNVFNISQKQWEDSYKSRLSQEQMSAQGQFTAPDPENMFSQVIGETPVSASPSYQEHNNAGRVVELPTTPPESIGSIGGNDISNFFENSFNSPQNNNDVEDIDDIETIMGLFKRSLNSGQQKTIENNPAQLKVLFDKFTVMKRGETYNNLNSSDKVTIVNLIRKNIAEKENE